MHQVIFEGETTFGYKEWSGPLVSVSGTDITVQGASGAVLNGDGARWWDGKGTNGGKTKPKFFYAHKMINSKIDNIYVKNSPVQVFSINGASELTLNKVTVNNADGDSKGGHNTDAFDVGSSTGVYITSPTVHNQDDCLAVNSGKVGRTILFLERAVVGLLMVYWAEYSFHGCYLYRWTRYLDWFCWWTQ